MRVEGKGKHDFFFFFNITAYRGIEKEKSTQHRICSSKCTAVKETRINRHREADRQREEEERRESEERSAQPNWTRFPSKMVAEFYSQTLSGIFPRQAIHLFACFASTCPSFSSSSSSVERLARLLLRLSSLYTSRVRIMINHFNFFNNNKKIHPCQK